MSLAEEWLLAAAMEHRRAVVRRRLYLFLAALSTAALLWMAFVK